VGWYGRQRGICVIKAIEWARMGMARGSGDQDGKRSFRVVLTDVDFDVLEIAAGTFGVGKSELVRRLVRASVDVGPALSSDGLERIEALTGQVRAVGRNLMQVLKAIHRGDAVGIAESEPVWRGLQEMIAALDVELMGLVEGNGVLLRERAGLAVVVAQPDDEAA